MNGVSLGLKGQRRAVWWPDGARFAADFVSDRYMRDGVEVSAGSAIGCSRASGKWAQDASGTWQYFAANTLARTNLGALIEPAGTNLVPNPGLSGAVVGVVGAGGSLPTGWYHNGVLATEVVALTTLAGLPAIRIKISGVAASTFYELGMVPTTTALSPSTAYSASLLTLLHSGAAPVVEVRQATSADGFVVSNVLSPAMSTSIARGASSFTTQATTARGRLRVTFVVVTGQSYAFEFTVACPQIEAGSTVTSPCLVSRNADTPVLQLPSGTFSLEFNWGDGSTTNVTGATGSYPFTTTLPRTLLRRTTV